MAIPEAIPMAAPAAAPPTAPRAEPWADAARLFEQALKTGPADPQVAYLLALCYKRQGKTNDARTALRKISKPDANVLLQMGLLSFQENNFAQAEQEFARALEMDPNSYETCFNLFLARLSLGKMEPVLALLPKLGALASDPDEQRFLRVTEPLFRDCMNPRSGPPPLPKKQANGVLVYDTLIPEMTAGDEERFLQIIRSVSDFEVMFPLLRGLATGRPNSQAVQETFLEAVLVRGKQLADHCDWDEARQLLQPLARLPFDPTRASQEACENHIAMLNLLGCCECMMQEFDAGIRYFQTALRMAGNDAWLHQNLALAFEYQGRLDQADTHWNRYFDLLDRKVPVPSLTNYLETLAYEGLNRLADTYQKKEKWNSALTYLQRAHRLRPADTETLERLFHLYNQVKRPEDARRTLRRLREMRPNDPQFELYELDLREVKTLEDLDRKLADIRKTLSRYPNDARVEERAVNMVGEVIPLMGRLCDQLTDELSRVIDQVRSLPNYQINWPAVRDVMRDLQERFQKLRRITNKCLGLVTNEEHRRIIRDLSDHIDRKIEMCQSMGA